jgi:predicted RecA/RadA family phage recombinase
MGGLAPPEHLQGEYNMKNYIQDGDVVTVAAPYAVASGAGALVGTLFGVAAYTAAITEPVEVMTEGVFELPKLAAQAWTVGAIIYWDDTNKWCTTVASTNVAIGKALAIAANPSATGIVRLSGS